MVFVLCVVMYQYLEVGKYNIFLNIYSLTSLQESYKIPFHENGILDIMNVAAQKVVNGIKMLLLK